MNAIEELKELAGTVKISCWFTGEQLALIRDYCQKQLGYTCTGGVDELISLGCELWLEWKSGSCAENDLDCESLWDWVTQFAAPNNLYHREVVINKKHLAVIEDIIAVLEISKRRKMTPRTQAIRLLVWLGYHAWKQSADRSAAVPAALGSSSKGATGRNMGTRSESCPHIP